MILLPLRFFFALAAQAVKRRVLELFRQKQRAKLWHDYGPTLAAEELAEDHGIRVNRETLRQWLMEAKLWRARRSRIERAHLWRPRRARCRENSGRLFCMKWPRKCREPDSP